MPKRRFDIEPPMPQPDRSETPAAVFDPRPLLPRFPEVGADAGSEVSDQPQPAGAVAAEPILQQPITMAEASKDSPTDEIPKAARKDEPITPEPRPQITLSRRALLLGGLGLGAGAYVAGHFRVLGKLYEAAKDEPEGLVSKEDYKITIPWLPDSVRRWSDLIEQHSRIYQLDANLPAIIMTLESTGNPQALSKVQAKGLMQVTDPTAQDIAAKYLKYPRTEYDIWDPDTNIEFGIAYLNFLRNEFIEPEQGPSWDTTVEYIAAGYNGGPGAAGDLYNGRGLESTETAFYARNAMNFWRERHAAVSPTFNRWSAP